jgi:hypothetical protein
MMGKPPVLEITDGNGQLLWDASFRVLATMFHPDDPAARDQYIELCLARTVLDAASSEPTPQELILQASERVASMDVVLKRADKSAYGVAVTGDLLLTIISAAFWLRRHASLERAVRAWCQDQVRGKTGEGRGVAASARAVKASWSKFKPVAHLCAAFQISRDLGENSPLMPVDNVGLATFLAVAETLRKAGEAHHPPVGRACSKPGATTTLDPQSTWHLPANIVLPKVSFQIPPPPDFVLKVFSEYQAD